MRAVRRSLPLLAALTMLIVAAVAPTATAATATAATATFVNKCSYSVRVYDNKQACKILTGKSGCKGTIGQSAVYRNGLDSQATLAQFSYGNGKVWYDLSIVPPGSTTCKSYAACKKATGKKGFNTPIAIVPTSNRGADGSRCEKVTCAKEGCTAAFNYPSDYAKVFNCPKSTSFQVVFCP